MNDRCQHIHALDGYETYLIDEKTIGVRPMWYSAKDVWPGQFDFVLISDGKIVALSHFQDGVFVSKTEDIDVVYWMPIPKPPKGIVYD